MSNKKETRQDVLELLARGKINIDEAVDLLDQTGSQASDPVFKAEEEIPLKVDVDVDVDIQKESASPSDLRLDIENMPLPESKTAGREPRWLRIQVGDLDTGKSKVNVNVPFGMVKFGLGIAKVFTPDEYSANLEQIGSMMSEADSGVLVDVQDFESNEHVRIYFE